MRRAALLLLFLCGCTTAYAGAKITGTRLNSERQVQLAARYIF